MLTPAKIVAILVAVFILEVFAYNILKPDLPKIPGDIYLDKAGFKIYIPFVSALVLSVIATLAFHYLFG